MSFAQVAYRKGKICSGSLSSSPKSDWRSPLLVDLKPHKNGNLNLASRMLTVIVCKNGTEGGADAGPAGIAGRARPSMITDTSRRPAPYSLPPCAAMRVSSFSYPAPGACLVCCRAALH